MIFVFFFFIPDYWFGLHNISSVLKSEPTGLTIYIYDISNNVVFVLQKITSIYSNNQYNVCKTFTHVKQKFQLFLLRLSDPPFRYSYKNVNGCRIVQEFCQ